MQYRKLWLGLFALLCGAGLFIYAPDVQAEDAYPYADKQCIWEPVAVVGTPEWCADYDFGDVPGNESAASVISPYGYYYRNCTDYTAWKVSELGVPEALYKGLGNAKQWGERARLKGLRVDSVPAPGAVAVRITGQYGHTAFIDSVAVDGVLGVSQYNYHADGNFSAEFGTAAQFGFTEFIHFEDLLPPPIVPEVVAPEPVAIEPVEPAVEPEVVAADEPTTLVEITEALPAVEAEVVAVIEPPVPATPEPVDPPEPAQALMAAAVANPVPPATLSPIPVSALVPAPPAWRKAASSPPLASAAMVRPEPVIYAEKSAAFAVGYWPLIGLTTVLLAAHAAVKRTYV